MQTEYVIIAVVAVSIAVYAVAEYWLKKSKRSR